MLDYTVLHKPLRDNLNLDQVGVTAFSTSCDKVPGLPLYICKVRRVTKRNDKFLQCSLGHLHHFNRRSSDWLPSGSHISQAWRGTYAASCPAFDRREEALTVGYLGYVGGQEGRGGGGFDSVPLSPSDISRARSCWVISMRNILLRFLSHI